MSLNNGILLNGVLRPKLLNIYFASCSFLTFDFSLPHTAHFDDNIVLPVLVFNTLGSTFFVFFFAFQTICQHVYYELCLIYK